ncbi:DUF2269 family protein [Bizionia argentinensis JUB59]|uniref:DUF2269 family protein n=1 Tax=Bizionia argentinensis JUB59 TaxID=1046627 RepID=G2EDU5_9FLAO|nr:DUF2269 family protein [Bizionia argentinensis]EGV43357.1 DUF2269 family protein [Bizionia argentinensis JUB59]
MRETMLIVHFIGLAMGLGTGFVHAFLGKTLSKMNRNEAKKFRLQIKGVSQMGSIGTILLLVSGIYLLLPFWPVLTEMPLLILKLVLFLILVILIMLINYDVRNNYKNDTENNLKRIELMGKISLVIGVLIVIVAVNVFH